MTLEIRGLDALRPFSDDAHAARKRGLATVRRLTVVAEQGLRNALEDVVVNCGASGYTILPCSGAGRQDIERGQRHTKPWIRMEVVAPYRVAEDILRALRQGILREHSITACVESVDVVRETDFAPAFRSAIGVGNDGIADQLVPAVNGSRH